MREKLFIDTAKIIEEYNESIDRMYDNYRGNFDYMKGQIEFFQDFVERYLNIRITFKYNRNSAPYKIIGVNIEPAPKKEEEEI